MTLQLPPDVMQAVVLAAQRANKTPEELATAALREKFVTGPAPDPRRPRPSLEQLQADETSGPTLLERLAPVIGVLDGPGDMSQDVSRKFGDYLLEDHRRQSRGPV